jgi:hypothetical protein
MGNLAIIPFQDEIQKNVFVVGNFKGKTT